MLLSTPRNQFWRAQETRGEGMEGDLSGSGNSGCKSLLASLIGPPAPYASCRFRGTTKKKTGGGGVASYCSIKEREKGYSQPTDNKPGPISYGVHKAQHGGGATE